jgi:tetratricopeptide (TPR) repeat protein/TolB-like protein/predicted Ser/Thr protein kinase
MPASAQNAAGPSDAADLTGQTVGRFAIRARLGAGGMGEVYRADDTALKRPVALKRMAPRLRTDESFRKRFLREAQFASGLSNPHIAGVYDVLEANGEMFVVMEYVEGVTLRQRLAQPLSLAEFFGIAAQCISALAAAHQQGIVHRDIKPENIMLAGDGQVKILDFGVAKQLPRAEDVETLLSLTSTSGSFSGTPAYMAPETLLEKEPDPRADIFSLGVVFYEALSGRHPFHGENFVATTGRILHETPPPLSKANPKVPAELERIVAKMLAKNPAERYATSADLLVDLRAAERAMQSGAPHAAVLPQARPGVAARRRGWAIAAIAILAVAGLSLIPQVRHRLPWFGRPTFAGPKSVVVLPFHPVNPSQENQAFCDGMTEMLTVKLTQLTATHQLQVMPARDVRTRRVASAEEARKELGAGLVLEGSLDRSGSMARVNYALVDTASLRQVRAETITADASDPFALQDRVAEGVVEMLALELKPKERQQLQARDTQVAGAYDLYLQGRGYLQNYDKPENVDNAIRAFQQAIAFDPKFGLAQAALGEAYWQKYSSSKDSQWVVHAREACARAKSLESNHAAAYVCSGTLNNGTGEYKSAIADFQRAIELEPTSDDAYRGLAYAYEQLKDFDQAERTYRRAIEVRPHYWADYNWLGTFYFRRSRFPDAIEAFKKVVELAPESFRAYANLGAPYLRMGLYAEAIAAFERSVAIRPNAIGYSNLATAYFHQRRYADAARTFEEAVKLRPQDYELWWNLGDAYYWTPGRRAGATVAYKKSIELAGGNLKVNPRDTRVRTVRAMCYAMLGEKRPALADLAESLKVMPGDQEVRQAAALVYNQLGDTGKALEWLEKALAAGYSARLIRDTPNFDNLRTDPRFQDLVHEK